MSIPMPASPGRAGFGPQLALTYDSGAGNGPFGLGWSSVTSRPSPARPTRACRGTRTTRIRHLHPVRRRGPGPGPRAERDGALAGGRGRRTVGGRDYAVQRYRPRIEGLFARIERWTRPRLTARRPLAVDHPRQRDHLYGATADSRIADPADPAHVFSWLICESYDDKGNAVVYDYAAEDGAGVDTGPASERNRTDRPGRRTAT